MLRLRGAGVWVEQKVGGVVVAPLEERAADKVVVGEVAEALLADAVGEALRLEHLEGAEGGGGGAGCDVSDADDEAVAGEVSSAEFVLVEVGAEDADTRVFEGGEVLGTSARRVDGDDLSGDGLSVFHAGASDRGTSGVEVFGEDVEEFDGADACLLDRQVDVFAVAGGWVEGDFFDDEVFGALLERAAGGWEVGGEVSSWDDVRVVLDRLVSRLGDCLEGVLERVVEDVLLDVDRDAGGDAESDGVGGPAVDLQDVPLGGADAELGEEGVLGEVVDADGLECPAERLDDGREQIVGLRSLERDALQPAFDGLGLWEADDDGEGASLGCLRVEVIRVRGGVGDLAELDDLVINEFADEDSG